MGRGKGWRSVEDKALARAWLQCSEDAIDGAEQTSDTFFERVAALYAEAVPRDCGTRTMRSCRCRFFIVSREVQKFNACYTCIKKERQSGKTEKDLIEDAVRMFYQLEEDAPLQEFPQLEAWYVLKDSPKWKGQSNADMKAELQVGLKRNCPEGSVISKIEGGGGQTCSIVDMTDELSSQQEPEELKATTIGRKKAKAERDHLRLVAKIAHEFTSMRSALNERNDLLKEQTGAIKEQNFVLAFKGDELKGSEEAKEYFRMLAEEALLTKRQQLGMLHAKQKSDSMQERAKEE